MATLAEHFVPASHRSMLLPLPEDVKSPSCFFNERREDSIHREIKTVVGSSTKVAITLRVMRLAVPTSQ
jgi:hypothetical protein